MKDETSPRAEGAADAAGSSPHPADGNAAQPSGAKRPAPATEETARLARVAGWLGVNRPMLGVLVAGAGLGLAEEVWRPFFGPYLKSLNEQLRGAAASAAAAAPAGSDPAALNQELLKAVWQLGLFSCAVNVLEGFGYIIGGAATHRLGARLALVVSALPMVAGFALLLSVREPWAAICGALLITNWEPLSVPTTFEVVGAAVRQDRRTIAFAVQSIQKRLPKVIGPLIGGAIITFGFVGNLWLALAILAVAMAVQWSLLSRMRPRAAGPTVPARKVLKEMPAHLRRLLTAEIFLRWSDWFARDFASLYVVGTLALSDTEWGILPATASFVALATYIPVGKMVDRAASPKPFIGLTFLLFALFPILLVTLPKTGLPVMAALVIVFVLNGLREIGEPARKALIASSFPSEVRARAVGLYWGTRSFMFCPAPLVAALLWFWLGPEVTFLIGGGIGLAATAFFWVRVPTKAA
ncbi:MAG: MFS transporter [Planctomycetes bacterium]|nr:MFS transporter [Planctomycetota bacterium]